MPRVLPIQRSFVPWPTCAFQLTTNPSQQCSTESPAPFARACSFLCTRSRNGSPPIGGSCWKRMRPPRDGREAFEERHNVYHAGDGFILPRLMIVSEGDAFLLQWDGGRFRHQGLEFLSAGIGRAPKEQVRTALVDFVDAVLARLSACGVRETWLGSEWGAINKLADEESEFCQAAARLGADPFDLPDEEAQKIMAAASVLPPSLVEDVFRCASPDALTGAADWVLKGISVLDQTPLPAVDLRGLRASVDRTAPGVPWEQGYQVARQLRDKIRHTPDRPRAVGGDLGPAARCSCGCPAHSQLGGRGSRTRREGLWLFRGPNPSGVDAIPACACLL